MFDFYKKYYTTQHSVEKSSAAALILTTVLEISLVRVPQLHETPPKPLPLLGWTKSSNKSNKNQIHNVLTNSGWVCMWTELDSD